MFRVHGENGSANDSRSNHTVEFNSSFDSKFEAYLINANKIVHPI